MTQFYTAVGTISLLITLYSNFCIKKCLANIYETVLEDKHLLQLFIFNNFIVPYDQKFHLAPETKYKNHAILNL